MRTNRFIPKGIIRSSGEHEAGDGACDEIINMRYENGSLRTCGPKEVVASDIPYFAIYAHHRAGGRVYIGQAVNTEDEQDAFIGVYDTDDPSQFDSSGLIARFEPDDELDVKMINNLVIISSKKNSRIYTYAYENGEYRLISDGTLPDIVLDFNKVDYYGGDIDVSAGVHTPDFTLEGVAAKYVEAGSLTADMVFNDIDAGLVNVRHARRENRSEGYVGVCATFTLFDGSETKPSTPVWFYLGGRPKIQFGKTYGNVGQGDMYVSMPTSSLDVWISSLKMAAGKTYASYKDTIKSINIYCTYPRSGYDVRETMTSDPSLQESFMFSVDSWAKVWDSSKHQDKSRVLITPTKFQYEVSGNGGYGIPYDIPITMYPTEYMDFESEIFYLQKTVQYQDDISKMNEVVHLDFTDRMLTGRAMKVDSSGHITRYGKMMAYNSRIHLYDTVNTVNIPGDMTRPTSSSGGDSLFGRSWMPGYTYSEINAFQNKLASWTTVTGNTVNRCDTVVVVTTRKEGAMLTAKRNISSLMIRRGAGTTADPYKYYLLLKYMPSIIDADDINVEMYVKRAGSTTSQDKYFVYKSALTPFKSYNFSVLESKAGRDVKFLEEFYPNRLDWDIGIDNPTSHYSDTPVDDLRYSSAYDWVVVDVTDSTTNASTYAAKDAIVDSKVYTESDVVVVSAQNNPAYFAPENSYRVGGRILSLCPNTSDVSDARYGAYPLAAFTDDGVYAISQGEGNVLYSTITKLSEDKINPGTDALSTSYGMAFLSGNGVFMLSGRRSYRISSALDGPPDYDIRNCIQYRRAHQKYVPSGTADSRLVDITNYLSDDFRDEVSGADKVYMLFDFYRAELIVSFNNRPYSYVYSFEERAWHKITEKFTFSDGGLAISEMENATLSLKNIARERHDIGDTILTHVQTRCLKFGTESYKAVHRVIGRVNINNTHDYTIPNTNFCGMYLYASRDMRNWSMVGLNQAIGYADIFNINKTSAHFKYFLISLGGNMITDSEVSVFDADVQYRYEDKER